MEEKITVVLVDGNLPQCLSLGGLLEETGHFRVVGAADDGRMARDIVRQLRPQIVITDLYLPTKDGLTLLRCFDEMGDDMPWTIVLSSFCADHILAEAARLGAFYCMAKPVDLSSLTQQMLLAVRTPHRVASPIARTLHELTIPHASRVFRSLELSIQLVIDDDDILNAMTKELYPAVAQKLGCSADSVETEIRRAIAKVWKYADPAVIRKYFPNARKKPANREFIATLADHLLPIMKV